MAHNDYIKDLVLGEIAIFKLHRDETVRQHGINAEKALHKVNCFVCMDTLQLWAWRRHVAARSVFSTHRYDLIKCNGCSTGADIKTMASTKGFEKDNKDGIQLRISMLLDIYNAEIKPEEQRRAQEERIERERQERLENERREAERIQNQIDIYEADPNSVWGPGRYSYKHEHATDSTFDADVQKLANIVFASIELYGGNYLAIADIAKNLVLTLTSTISEIDETDEVIGATEPDVYGNRKFVIIKLKKTQKDEERRFFGLFHKKTHEYSLRAEYLVLDPKNSKARHECSRFISGEMTKFIEKMGCDTN